MPLPLKDIDSPQGLVQPLLEIPVAVYRYAAGIEI
jgi:hypothetical protein